MLNPTAPARKRSTGDTLEALVRKSAAAQVARGLRLKQTGAIFKGKVGAGGKARGRVVAKGDLDFVGDHQGRAVGFDAKSTKVAGRFDLSLLKRHQVVICKNSHGRGALAFFLVEFSTATGGPRYFALTWPVLKAYWTGFDHLGSPASIPFAVFEEQCLEVKRTGATLDLVGAVEALLRA